MSLEQELRYAQTQEQLQLKHIVRICITEEQLFSLIVQE